MNTEKPINCPLCDGKAMCVACFTNENPKEPFDLQGFKVMCMNPNCLLHEGTSMCSTQQDAVSKWNIRKPLDNIKNQLSAKIDEIKGYDTTAWRKYSQALEYSISLIERSKEIE